MDKNSILEKLQDLWDQLLENRRLHEYAQSGCTEETVRQLMQIQEAVGQFPSAPGAANCKVTLPLAADHCKAAGEEKAKRQRLLLIVGAVTAVLLIIYFLSHVHFFNTVSVIGIFATAIIGWFYKMSNDMWKKKNKEFTQAQELHEKTRAQFHNAMSGYEREVAEGMKQYQEYELRLYQNYPKFCDELMAHRDKEEAARQAAQQSDERIAQNDIISQEYYHLIPKIISMLKSGRADSYKEALNMAIEEERQEAAEAARREAEERRIAAIERQAEEERRHNMMMEQQQAEHNRAMEKAEQDRARAEDRARRDADRAARAAESDAKSKAWTQCRVCAKFSGCRNPGIPGCGAFVPRK